MEIITIEKQAFEEMMRHFADFTKQVENICGKNKSKEMTGWLDNQEVCLMLNISPRTLQYYRETGKIGYSQVGHKVYYKPADIEKFMKSH